MLTISRRGWNFTSLPACDATGWADCGLEEVGDAGCRCRVATMHWQRGRTKYKSNRTLGN